tara:strand:+ start:8722 stop:9261 length:540 start_codon:yes stop_codon:yes gene_type:complete
MREPTTFQWLIGNAPVSLLVNLTMLASIWFWYVGQLNGWLTVAAIAIGSVSFRASERVSRYSAWKREWDGGGGRGFRLPRIPGLKYATVFAVWLAFAAMALDGADDGGAVQIAVALFWIAAVVMIGTMLFRLGRGPLSRGRAGGVVAVCVSANIRSPSVSGAISSLPAYCKRLIGFASS